MAVLPIAPAGAIDYNKTTKNEGGAEMDEERLRAMIREELEPACRQVAALEKETRSLFQWMMAQIGRAHV